MYSHASLIISEYIFRRELENIFSTKENLERFSNSIKEDNITHKEAVKSLTAFQTFVARSNLLERDISKVSNEELQLKLALLEVRIDDVNYNERLYKGRIELVYNSVPYSFESDSLNLDIAKLTLNRALKDGYKFKEIIGSHYLVLCPIGKTYAVTSNRCNCLPYQQTNQCHHNLAVQGLIQNRSLCKTLQETAMPA